LRKELGIPVEARIIGYIGEIRRERNLDTLVEAVARLLPAHPDLYLVMVGDHSMEPREPERLKGIAAGAPQVAGRNEGEPCPGRARPSVGRVDSAGEGPTPREDMTRDAGAALGATEVGLAGRLLFTGHRLDPERFYRMFDVYVLPSTREGFGVTLIEAMATGVPVIACRVRVPREIVEDGRDGILVEDRDPDALAEAIYFYLQAPEAVESYTRRARRKVEREFDHARMRAQLYEEYRRLTS
jgi:glycosyltransferase involved in cell wall biosynthesis